MNDGAGVTALIAAAGSGTRLGNGPKALVRLAGRTLLEHTLDAFDGLVDEVIVALPGGLLAERGTDGGPRYIAGGESRQESIRHLLDAADSGLVVIHDVARPLLPADVLQRVVAAARSRGAASAAVAVTDTVVRLAGRGYGEVVDRSTLRAIQTPQAFDRELLLEAHARAAAKGLIATDDAALVRALGAHVELVAGSPLLLKITEPADLLLAEVLLPRWQEQAGAKS